MAEHIVCVTAEGGIPLFTRTRPGVSPLPFPVMASLNGVHLFARNRDVNLLSTTTDDHKIVWKTYQGSIVLIVMIRLQHLTKSPSSGEGNCDIVESSVSDSHYLRLLDKIFHALVLLMGLDEFCKFTNAERLKKDLRATYKLIDSFMEQDQEKQHFGNFSPCVDMLICNEAPMLQEHLNAFAESASSTYGCLVANRRVVCATEKWWMLTGLELSLLTQLICLTSPTVTSCDIPVYLPHSSANIPHRLLMFTLVTSSLHTSFSESNVRVCILCGPEPSLMEVQGRLVERFWRSGVDMLQKSVMSYMAGFPPNLTNQLPQGLMAFLLVNRESCQCVSSVLPFDTYSRSVVKEMDSTRNLNVSEVNLPQALAEFYSAVVGTVSHFPEVTESDTEKLELTRNVVSGDISCRAHYQCRDSHKAFALLEDRHQIFCLYHPTDTPSFALRDITRKVLGLLTKENQM